MSSGNNIPSTLPPTFDYSPDAPQNTPAYSSEGEIHGTSLLGTSEEDIFEIGLDSLNDDDDSDDDDKFFRTPQRQESCPPCESKSSPQLEAMMDSVEVEMPSVTSLLDYDIFEGIIPEMDRFTSHSHAYVPVGALTASEQKRKEFMNYLRKTGFLSAISEMLLSLWDEEVFPDPEFAIEYLAKCLGYKLTIHDDIAENSTLGNSLRVRIQRLEVENDWMRRHLDNFEKSESPIEIVDACNFPPIIFQEHRDKKNRRTLPKSIPSSTVPLSAEQLTLQGNSSIEPPTGILSDPDRYHRRQTVSTPSSSSPAGSIFKPAK